MMRKLIISLIVTLLFPISVTNAGVTKFGVSFGHSFEDYKNFEFTDHTNFEDNLKTPNFNITHFYKNGFVTSASSNRLINYKSKRHARQSDQDFSYEIQSFIDTISVGYKIKKVTTSLILANVNLESRAYNNYFDKKSKISAIVPALNFSYHLTTFKGVSIVPSVSFYSSSGLGITRGMLANINFMF